MLIESYFPEHENEEITFGQYTIENTKVKKLDHLLIRKFEILDMETKSFHHVDHFELKSWPGNVAEISNIDTNMKSLQDLVKSTSAFLAESHKNSIINNMSIAQPAKLLVFSSDPIGLSGSMVSLINAQIILD